MEEDGLEAVLQKAWEAGRAAWPSLAIAPEAFMRHLAQRMPAGAPLVASLGSMEVQDLYLACGCLQGDPTALAEFERHFLSQVSAYLARGDALPGFTDEVKQLLRVHLFVPGQETLPRIAAYTGRGPLGAWLRVTAVRSAINLRNAGKSRGTADRIDAMLAEVVSPDPELALLKMRHGREFRAAFEAALETLSDREGTIIQLYFLRGMTAAQIASLYDVTWRTVQRWVAAIQEKILAETRRHLASQLSISVRELDALMRVMQSQLSSTIARFFDKDPPR